MEKYIIYHFAGNAKMYVSITLYSSSGMFTSNLKKAKIFNILEVAESICSELSVEYKGIVFDVEKVS